MVESGANHAAKVKESQQEEDQSQRRVRHVLRFILLKQTAHVPFHHCREEIVNVTHHVPQEPVKSRTTEQIVDLPVYQILMEIVEVITIVPQERVSELIAEHMVVFTMTPSIRKS